MTAAAHLTPPNLQLAWSSSGEDDQLFFKLLRGGLIALLVLGIVIPLIPSNNIAAPVKPSDEVVLTEVIIEPREIPKPPPVKPKPIVKEKPPEKLKKPKPVLKKPEPKKVVKVPKPAPKIEPTAKQKAEKSGLLQFQDDLQAMRESVDMSKMQGANITQGAAQAKTLDRSVITSQAKATSGGISTASLSRDVGGVALSGRETTRIESELASATGVNPRASSRTTEIPARSIESVRKVMDRNQGPIFSIYNRALRKDPALQGKFVVKMVIEPSGKVSEVKLLSSELSNPALEKKLLSRVRLIQFTAESVIRTAVDYTFDFLPY